MADEATARREYWTQQMDQAFEFMQRMRTYPVEECGESLVSMPQVAAEAGVEVRFASTPIALDLPRVFFLRAGLIPNFLAAAREMNERGWIMKLEDGFRSVTMQQNLSRKPSVFDAILKTTMWELGGKTPDPQFLLKRVAALTAVRPKVGTHMSGSAIDISVFRREDGTEVDRGKPYLEMSEMTPMASPFVSVDARRNRHEITRIMESNGFIAYPFEFWHYNSGDCYAEFLTNSGKPGRYGAIHFDETEGKVEPISSPDELLQPHEVIEHEIEQSLLRLRTP